MKVFISGTAGFGSSSEPVIPEAVKKEIDKCVKNNYSVLVGDCCGIDTSVQSYLKEKGYKNVTVCCSGEKYRNFLDKDWYIMHIYSRNGETGRDLYTLKDREMCEIADTAIAI